ncbi:MAG: outer membrane protein assembly factor BamA [Vicinamibacterales bacterium]
MFRNSARVLAAAALVGAVVAGPARAQDAPVNPAQIGDRTQPTICGQPVPPPRALPPEGSGPVIYLLAPCFAKQGGNPNIDPQTYLYYIQLRPSQPSQDLWVPYDERAEETMLADFRRLWATSFLDDLVIDVQDYVFSNGVVGKLVTYDMEERERVKIVDYKAEKLDRTKIEEQLQQRNIELRLDSFLDLGTIRRVEGLLRDMMAEEGYTEARVSHVTTPVSGGPKLVNVTFTVDQGPKIRIRDVEFVGNTAFGDGTLQRRMKENKPKGFLSFITGGGTYKEAKFEEDADRVLEHYRNNGYVRARIGQPELRVLEEEDNGANRWVELRIPVTEGPRYKVGEFTFDGNDIVTSDALRTLFELEQGDWYDESKVRQGLVKAREVYGAGGYFEFTGFPDLQPVNDGLSTGEAAVPEAIADTEVELDPTVNVTMRLQEGKQYFINRIVFVGNTTTRDNVIRRELRMVEGGVFNTEALKFSVRRLNQLGYFRPLDENAQDIQVDKTPGRDNAVDLTLKLEEQNRNQLTFGAGVSQFEGFFGQLGFQTANFLGRGESLTLSLQGGSRSQNYQLAFTEPFLFDRNITGGFDIYRRQLQYIGFYTQKSTGANITFGFPVADFSRMFVNYSLERSTVADLSEALIDPACVNSPTGCSTISNVNLSQLTPEQAQIAARNPFVFDSLLIGQGGQRTISKVVPSFISNTVDNPIFPTRGRRYTASLDIAGLGGNTSFLKPVMEGIWYIPHTARTSIGARAQFQYVGAYGSTGALPIFERLVLGGEYSVRGYDIRSIGPTVPGSNVVLGGNKSLLFNLEYLISIAGPVRLVLFYDAGQVRGVGDGFGWKEDLTQLVAPPPPLLFDPFAPLTLRAPNAADVETEVIGRTSAFKTSTGAEIRFFMPVLNVPFRLIMAANPQRGNVLTNRLTPARDFTFRFAVGTTF